ncbi:MAG: protein kinase [Byssovorax sp.]
MPNPAWAETLDAAQGTPAPDSPPASGAPALLGERYEILGLLGAGGMGNVYRARDRELDEVVALKVLRPELIGAPGALERFRREVKLARKITHPNVARVFDIGEHGGSKIFTMELVEGESLGAVLAREKKLPLARVVELASALCEGLAAAHAVGVIHRDLKPDNVLIETGGRVLITDFGIARGAAPDAASTVAFMGTPAYMAPEQVQGGAVDARTDLYALGCVLFELLTGRPPWRGDTILAVAVARLLQPPPDPRDLAPDLPSAAASVVMRCMARDPGERFGSAGEVATALASITLPAAAVALEGAAPPRSIPATPPLFEAPGAGKKSVAVLPFRNAGPPEHDYLADGLTEDVIDVLSMTGGLEVRSRGMAMRYKGAERDPREIGREFGVSVVVEGTVRRAGSIVRISARLVSVRDGVQLWARRFERPEPEVLALGDDTARAVAEALTLAVGERLAPAAVDPEAMDLYLRARAAYHRHFDDTSGAAYLGLFERALALAPDNPRLLAGYAMARARVWTSAPEVRAAAEQAAAHAAARAPDVPETHLAVATVRYQSGEAKLAVPALRRALALQPSNADAHELLGRILAETRLCEHARRHLTTALTLEPDHVLGRFALTRLHELDGRHDEAELILDARPGLMMPALSRMLMWRRDARRAAELLPRIVDGHGPSGVSRLFLQAAAGLPLDLDYLQRVAQTSAAKPISQVFFRQAEAELAAALGDREGVFASLARAAAGPCFDLLWADRCPLFAGLRDDPRFIAARDLIAARAGEVEQAYLATP